MLPLKGFMPARIVEYRVDNRTKAASLGSAVARSFLNDNVNRVDVSSIGMVAAAVVLKSMCYARSFMQKEGKDLIIVPAFSQFQSASGQQMTKIVTAIYMSENNLHLKYVETK